MLSAVFVALPAATASAQPESEGPEGPAAEPAPPPPTAPARPDPTAAPPAAPPPAGPPPGYYPGYAYDPPPPGGVYGPAPQMIYEPPPPPKPRHLAPKTALWLGARIGWFIPFGSTWAEGTPDGVVIDEVKWSRYASSGPMFELDAGLRLGRHYNVFVLWERASLGAGSEDIPALGKQTGGDTDFYAIGVRISSDPNKVGFLTEIDLGYRRARSQWDSGAELQLTQAPLEFRLGLGADIRLSKAFSLSPLVTLGVGSFGDAEWVNPDGSRVDATTPGDRAAGHGWITLSLGGHVDLFGGD